jgi:hypothetical protein
VVERAPPPRSQCEGGALIPIHPSSGCSTVCTVYPYRPDHPCIIYHPSLTFSPLSASYPSPVHIKNAMQLCCQIGHSKENKTKWKGKDKSKILPNTINRSVASLHSADGRADDAGAVSSNRVSPLNTRGIQGVSILSDGRSVTRKGTKR